MKAKEEDLARIGLDDKKVCLLYSVCGVITGNEAQQ